MSETSSILEAEIVELQKRIEEKRNLLEDKTGIIIEERDLVKSAITEMAGASFQTSTVPSDDDTNDDQNDLIKKSKATAVNRNNQYSISYLDNLDEESVTSLNNYIEKIPTDGIVKTIQTIAEENPFILDAFHDALVDKLYDDLKASGAIK